jgi:sigma54-dependent transcription regulator
MWPRLLAQLFELLPHVTRLVPLADRYLNSRSAAERAHEETLTALRTDLGGLTSANASLSAELAAQTQKFDHIAAQITVQLDRNRAELLNHGTQLQAVTQQLKRLQLWVVGSAVLSALLLLAILGLLLHAR